jgi:hypothetical protein
MAIDGSNSLWIASPITTSLMKIGADGHVTTVAGGVYASGICVDSGNNIYISSANRIYRLNANAVLDVFAGSGNPGSADGNWVFTSFNGPGALAVDAADNIYVWDSGNYIIRRINHNRDVETIAGKPNSFTQADGTGTNISISGIGSMCVDPFGNILFTSSSFSVRKMTPTTNVTTLAGSFVQSGYTNGPGPLARFNDVKGICVSQGTVYIVDRLNHRIRNIVYDPEEQPVMETDLELVTYPALKITGKVGRTYRVESSTNMSTWTPEATILLTRSPFLWFDPITVTGKKFYRAFLLP